MLCLLSLHKKIDVMLHILCGIYKMNNSNTKGVGHILDKYLLEYIAEAHCYLSINDKKYYFTRTESAINMSLPILME